VPKSIPTTILDFSDILASLLKKFGVCYLQNGFTFVFRKNKLCHKDNRMKYRLTPVINKTIFNVDLVYYMKNTNFYSFFGCLPSYTLIRIQKRALYKNFQKSDPKPKHNGKRKIIQIVLRKNQLSEKRRKINFILIKISGLKNK
jgi:hypothetical protein